MATNRIHDRRKLWQVLIRILANQRAGASEGGAATDESQAVFDALVQHTFALFMELVNYSLECANKPKNARLQRITEYNQVEAVQCCAVLVCLLLEVAIREKLPAMG